MAMTSRELVTEALNHRQTDRVPVDFGGTVLTGMNVSTVYKLRQALKLDPPGTPVKVIDVFQMLGEIKPDLQAAVGGDVVNVSLPYTIFGYANVDWKPWTTFDGTPVLVPGGFNTEPDAAGNLLQYPQGDRSVPPSGKMPKGGFYCDAVIRQDQIFQKWRTSAADAAAVRHFGRFCPSREACPCVLAQAPPSPPATFAVGQVSRRCLLGTAASDLGL